MATAEKNGWALCIIVVDPGGEAVMLHRMDGTAPAIVQVATGKAKAAAAFAMATKDIEVFAKEFPGFNTLGFAALQGGLPILKDGRSRRCI